MKNHFSTRKSIIPLLLVLFLSITLISTMSIQASALESTGNAKMDAFINDPRWTDRASYGADTSPKLNPSANWGSCAAYCYDYVLYCYDSYNPRSGESFTNIDEIRAGDVVIVGNPSDGSGHWLVVLKRSENKLYTAEGNATNEEENYNGQARIGWNYTISGNKFAEDSRSFNIGYHYLDEQTHTHSYTDTTFSPTCTSKGYTVHVCSCGANYIDNYTPALGHSWQTKSSSAPDDATYFNGHYYKIYKGSLSWNDAKEKCVEYGGHLATITSSDEQLFIEQLNSSSSRLWIGASRDDDFNWYWVTGEQFIYTNWASGEPNDSSNVVSNENCVAVWPKQWNDLNERNLSEQSGYICEWDADYPVTYECSRCGVTKVELSTPVITKIENASAGVKITWNKVTGAEKYRVYYKLSGNTKWNTFKDVTSTSATVTNLTSGMSYVFTVKALAGSSVSATKSSIDHRYCAMPTVSKTENTTNGIKLTWGKVGATKYRIYYRLSTASKYTTFKDVTGTSATVTGLTPGKSYVFTVKAYNGSTWSAYKATSAIVYRPTPVISKLTNAAKGITVTWNKISGATKYRVYYKLSDASKYTTFKDVTTNSVTVTGLTSGKSYVFTVKAYVGDGWSGNKASSAIVRVNAVTFSGLSNSASKTMKATWKKDTTLTGYQIQYGLKKDFSDAKTITVKSNSTVSQTIKSLTKGKTYYVRIRGYKTVSKATTYGAWSAAKTVKISK